MENFHLFSAFLEYEKRQDPTFFESIIRLFVLPFKIFKKIVFAEEVYYYEGRSAAMIVSDKKYMLSSSLKALAGEGHHVISREKLSWAYGDHERLAKRASLKELSRISSYVSHVELSFSRRLALLSAVLDYSSIEIFNDLLKDRFLRINKVICNDPASPFVRNYLNLGRQKDCSIELLCETRVTEHSTEWLEFESLSIYALENRGQSGQLKQHLGIDCFLYKQATSDLKSEIGAQYKYSILFFQQYYHPLAFKSRVRHFLGNVQIAARPSVLMRLHPNERFFEKTLYQAVGLLGIVNLSISSIEEDSKLCRFAVSYTSTAIEKFRLRTDRPGRYLKSNNLTGYQ
tara:strand:- start:6373 stop:7404 length:1032 start_codon:yes stop_codon:yes gene_type:complete